jgi:hypothetical protein
MLCIKTKLLNSVTILAQLCLRTEFLKIEDFLTPTASKLGFSLSFRGIH